MRKCMLLAVMLLTQVIQSGALAQTRVLYSEDFDRLEAGSIAYAIYTGSLPDWSICNRNNTYPAISVVADGDNNYLSISNAKMGASRNGYCTFTPYSDYVLRAGWKLTFRAAITPGDTNGEQCLAVMGKKSIPTGNATNPEAALLKLTNSTAKGTEYTVVIGNTSLSETLTLAAGTWYHFTLDCSDEGVLNVTVSDETSDVFNKQAYIDENTTGLLYGLYYLNARYNGTTCFDDILLMGYDVEEPVDPDAFKGAENWGVDFLTLTTNHISKSNTYLPYTTNARTFQNGEVYHTLTNSYYYTVNLPEAIGVNLPNASGNWVLRYQGAGRSDRNGLYWTGNTDATLAIDNLTEGQWVEIVTLYTEPTDLVGLTAQEQWREMSLSAQNETIYHNIYKVNVNGTATITLPTGDGSSAYVRRLFVYDNDVVSPRTFSVTPEEGMSGYALWKNTTGWNVRAQGGVSTYSVLKGDGDGQLTLSESIDGIIPPGATILLQRIDGKTEPILLTSTSAIPLANATFSSQIIQKAASDITVTAGQGCYYQLGLNNGLPAFKLVDAGKIIPADSYYIHYDTSAAEWLTWLKDDTDIDYSAVMALNWKEQYLQYDLTKKQWDNTAGSSTIQQYIYYSTLKQPTTVNYHVQFSYVPEAKDNGVATIYLSNSNHNTLAQVNSEKFFGIRTGAYGDMKLLRVTDYGQIEESLGAYAITPGGTLQCDIYGYIKDDTKYTLIRLTDMATGQQYEKVINAYYVPKALAIAIGSGAKVQMQQFTTWSEQMSQPAERVVTAQNRGLWAMINKERTATFVNWRARSIDNDLTQYRLYRNDQLAGIFTDRTNTTINSTDTNDHYRLEVVQDGTITETQTLDSVLSNTWFLIPLNRPVNKRTDCTWRDYSQKCDPLYFPSDATAYDMDGDGEEEIVMKWEPQNANDNNYPGVTANTIIDCYKQDGRMLWRIDIGQNERSGPHYVQFMVYDFDGDGKGEMIVQTAPGAKDGLGNDVFRQKGIDPTVKYYQNYYGHIGYGEEWLTCFEGTTGRELSSIDLYPAWSIEHDWGETNRDYNRSHRMRGCVAFLDGKTPSAVIGRGYYTQCFLTAYNFNGTDLYEVWRHESRTKGEDSTYGQGSHSVSVGDVDGDGCDEIILGASALDNDGTILWNTHFGHGDATHLGDFDPDHEGMEFFYINEDWQDSPYSAALLDARTGEMLAGRAQDRCDTGRGVIGDFDKTHRGAEWMSTEKNTYEGSRMFSCNGEVISLWYTENSSVWPAWGDNDGQGSYPNFRIYWDGDLFDEWHDTGHIDKWDSENMVFTRMETFKNYPYPANTCNYTKQTPVLQSDLLGDWREEVVYWTYSPDSTQLYLIVHTTDIPTEYRLPWLRDDHVYDMAIAWQNIGYNQPPHLSYSPAELFDAYNTGATAIKTVANTTESRGKGTIVDLMGRDIKAGKTKKGVYIRNGKKFIVK